MTMIPPGWYDDGNGAVRWWDGGQWTQHVAPAATMVADAPGATPAGSTPAGSAPAAPKASRLWILWVGLGVLLVAIVVAAALTIPLLLTAAADRGNDRGGSPSGSGGSEPADVEVLSPETEDAARETYALFDHAWQYADCDEYFASTTENYRTMTESESCEDFYRQARDFMSSVVDYSSTVDEVEAVGDAVAVSAIDRYDAYWDKEGEPTETLHPYTDYLEYLLIEVDGEWRIDDWFYD